MNLGRSGMEIAAPRMKQTPDLRNMSLVKICTGFACIERLAPRGICVSPALAKSEAPLVPETVICNGRACR